MAGLDGQALFSFLTSQQTASEVASPFGIPTSNEGGFLPPHVLVSTGWRQCLGFQPPWSACSGVILLNWGLPKDIAGGASFHVPMCHFCSAFNYKLS